MISGKVQFTAAEFAAKYRSKREVYRFLNSEVKCYLSGYDTMTIWHLKDLASGKRKRIKCEAVKVLPVPQFEGLTISDMLDYGRQDSKVMECLPAAEAEILKLPRQYIANVIYTVVGDAFADWVENRIIQRNHKIATEKELMIEMDAEIAAIFRASTAVSGKYSLMKPSVNMTFLLLQSPMATATT